MDDTQLEASFVAELAARIGRERFDVWFASQTRLSVAAGRLTVLAASTFLCDWLRRSFGDDLRAAWQAVAGPAAVIEFEADGQLNGELLPAVRGQQPAPSNPQSEICNPPSPPELRPAVKRTNVPLLASFVVGPCNEYAFRSAELTARGRQQASPILFCGPTGVGKTHLVRAAVAEFRRRHPRSRAVYLTAEQFTTSYVEAVRGAGLPSFRQKCRGAELLAIDDVQFFAGKPKTIEEFQYTVDTIIADGRQLLLASDRNLADLRTLGAELASRLSGGLICEIDPPDFAARLSIARLLRDELALAADDDVLALVATQFSAGARELRGALHRLHAVSTAWQRPITLELAHEALAELARQSTRTVRLADVEEAVCSTFGVEASQLRSERKGRTLSEPRMLAMWLARKYTRSAWSEIGHFFGRRSHSTVIAAHRRVEKLISSQAQIGVANQSCRVEDVLRRLESALRTA